jgi:hypoxanthine-DNA glycosylase
MEVLSKYSFLPIVGPKARLLVLGTLPGEVSLELQQYYGHSRNQFWPIIAEICAEDLPPTYSARVEMMLRSRIALWDVLHSAERNGTALDSAIKNECANDFATFFRRHPLIRTVAFNGNNARKFFKRHVEKKQDLPPDLFFLPPLPSTSPAFARPLEAKAVKWREALVAASLSKDV